MKKNLLFILSVSSVLSLLTACASVNGQIEQLKSFAESRFEGEVLNQSGISQDDDYLQYQEKREANQVNPDGSYIGDEGEYKGEAGSIHVTFARNPYISVEYYADAGHISPISGECTLSPGGHIYCTPPTVTNAPSKLYRFQNFRAWEYDNTGAQIGEISLGVDNTGTVLTIPQKFNGAELSIEPVGEFQSRMVTLLAYKVDANGEKQELPASGSWEIGNRYYANGTVELDPTEQHEIAFYYDNDEYYFVRSEPAPYYQDNDEGLVIFPTLTRDDEQSAFSVELRRYYTIQADGAIQGIADSSVWDVFKNRAIYWNYYEHGETVYIEIKSDYVLQSNDVTLYPEDIVGGRRYAFTIPDTTEYDTIHLLISKEGSDDFSEYRLPSIPNGVIEVTDADGVTLKDGAFVGKSDKVTVSIIPNYGYYVSGKSVSDGVYKDTMSFSKYQSDIDKIIREHEIKKLIHVTLNPNDPHGVATFKLDGKEVSGTIELRDSQKLTLEYEVTDPNYHIEKSGGISLIKGLFAKEGVKKETVNILVNPELDNATLSPSDYITLVKEE